VSALPDDERDGGGFKVTDVKENWETFFLLKNLDGTYSIKNFHNEYMRINRDLPGNSLGLLGDEKFYIGKYDGKVFFESPHWGIRMLRTKN
jgi:hypothetical protein